MIWLSPPTTAEDRSTVIDMACDYTEEQLHLTGLLPASSLLTADTVTLIARKDTRTNTRPVGALATATWAVGREDGPYSAIHAVYLQPRWRKKGYGAQMIAGFCIAAPYMPLLRGPLTPPLTAYAEALGIPVENLNDVSMLDMVTSSFLNTVGCSHAPDPCRSCVYDALRHHFVSAYGQMEQQLKKAQVTA